MASVANKDSAFLSDMEAKYNEITVLYDMAAELVETVESRFVTQPDRQWSIVEPLINELGEAADILSEEFIHGADGLTKGASKISRARVEGSLRRIYMALNQYRERVRDVTKQAYSAIENIADPIVQRIHRQIEHIVVIFLEFVQLSLSSIMNHSELSQLKAREARVALMMHQNAVQPQ